MRRPDFPQLSIDELIQLVAAFAENPEAVRRSEPQARELRRWLEAHDAQVDSASPSEQLCPAARIDAGEHCCALFLRPHQDLPGGLWSWSVYIDGNIHRRGPGSTRKDPTPLYATVFKGKHRVVVRSPFKQGDPRLESNTIWIDVNEQKLVLLDVLWRDGRPYLERSEDVPEWLGD